MDLTLIRKEKSKSGIFGVISELDLVTLEHSYPVINEINLFEAKITCGVHECKRGMHKLSHMYSPFETYEVMVEGHTDLLFHVGNYNIDSHGCILLGKRFLFVSPEDKTKTGIFQSAIAFKQFLESQKEVDSFKLTVQDDC
jgi:hypothetical protein